jgi:hypothetical protein
MRCQEKNQHFFISRSPILSRTLTRILHSHHARKHHNASRKIFLYRITHSPNKYLLIPHRILTHANITSSRIQNHHTPHHSAQHHQRSNIFDASHQANQKFPHHFSSSAKK